MMICWLLCLLRRHEWRSVDVRYFPDNLEIWACARCGKLDVRRMREVV